MTFYNNLAITGGIGSGKSTVLKLFEENGYTIINADLIARDIANDKYEHYGKYAKEIDDWLKTDFASQREIKRDILRPILLEVDGFQKIAKISQPYIEEQMNIIYENAKKQNKKIVFEIPLLLESGLYKNFEKILVVTCDLETKKSRIRQRDPQITEKDINHRINIQSSDEEKKKIAHYILDNSGSLSSLKEKFDSILKEVEVHFNYYKSKYHKH